ncbi:MAG: hypothetical protein ACUVWX_06430, partial [Kiritimatiellia bacterium]
MTQRESVDLVLTFDPESLTGQIVHKSVGTTWRFNLGTAPGVAVRHPEPMVAEFPWSQHCRALGRLRSLLPSDLRRVRETGDGLELGFHVGGADFRVVLRLSGAGNEIIFKLQPLPTGRVDLIAADLPGPVVPEDGSPIQVLLFYQNQGRLFTGRPGVLEPQKPQLYELDLAEGQYRMRFFG